MQIEARPATRIVEVFADVACPFTHVGIRRLVSGREALDRRDVVLRVHAWPLEIVNGAPIAADLVAEEIDALCSTVARGLFRGFDPSSWPGTSLPAFALAAHGYAVNDRAGERVSLALRDALFEHGRDISDPDVLARIARGCEIDMPDDRDRATITADLADGRARGVIGSPHFFVDGVGSFCPSLHIERVNGELEVEIDRAGLTELLARCFGPTERPGD